MSSREPIAPPRTVPDRAALTDRLADDILPYPQAEFLLRQLALAFGADCIGPPGSSNGISAPPAPDADRPGLVPGPPERRRTEAEPATAAQLRMAEARYLTLVEQIPAVTFMASLGGGLNELYVSPQIEALLGFSQQEWLENPVLWYTRLHPEDQGRWHEEFARTCALGVPFRSDYRFLARDGHVVWVHGECQLVRDAEGLPLFLQGIAFDITETKKAEEALRQTQAELAVQVEERTAELARANEALRAEIRERRRLEEVLRQRADQLAHESRRKDQFLATLAHELRNPLAPICNALAILRRHDVSEAGLDWAREVMGRQVQHMTRLIEDLLDIARINQGKMDLRREAVDLATAIQGAVESARPFVRERRHELAVDLPAEPLRLHADPVRLNQVLVNLLSNAAKYTEPGGHIRLSAEREGREAVVRIRDDGIGIPPEMLERIFDMFTQVQYSLARTNQWGLGVGLTLVRTLVAMHGGSICAFSAGPGKGSEFVVRLPLLEG